MRSVLGTDVVKSPHKNDECIHTSFTKVWNLWRRYQPNAKVTEVNWKFYQFYQ
jgi:hypothetical protein